MNAFTATLVGLAMLSLFAIFLIHVRRMERDVDYAELRQHSDDDDNLTLLARIIANSVVASAP